MARLLSYLLDFIVLLVLGRALSRAIGFLFGPAKPRSGPSVGDNGPGIYGPDGRPTGARRGADSAFRGQTERDPVCGMFVSTEVSHRLRHNGETLHFCSEECLQKYQKQEVTTRN